MFRVVETSVHIVAGFHIFLGLLSVCVGVISSIKADVWLAHSVSPIWSGGFFIIAGVLGIWCARRKSSYVNVDNKFINAYVVTVGTIAAVTGLRQEIMCFTAFSLVSMVVSVVSIQLLRVGLINHTTDGHTFLKEKKDVLIYVSLAVAGTEILVCAAAILLSCRVARVAKEEQSKQRDGMFHVKVLGQKDIVVVTRPVDNTEELTAV